MTLTGFIFAIAAAITWGLVYTINQKILGTISPMTFLFLGSIITALITIPFLALQWDNIKEIAQSSSPTWRLIILGEVLVLVANFFILSSIKNLGAPTAAAIEIGYPFFVAIFTFLFYGGSINIWFWVGSILIFIGSTIIIKLT